MNVAVIGLGIIGNQWAQHLNKDGVLRASWNRSAKLEVPLYISKLAEVPSKAEILHVVVADPEAVREVLATVVPHLNQKHIIVQSSTIDPTSAQEFSALVQKTGAKYIEAPFTGSLPAAQKRELVFYVGGEAQSIEVATPYLSRLAKKVIPIGSESQASTLKLTMNLQIASALEALAEALSTARKAGISDECFYDAFRLNASFSGVAALKEPKLKGKEYAPQFSIKHMGKDLRLLQKSVPSLPVLETLVGLYNLADQKELGELDFSAMIELR